jgi:hypothetical protein
MTDSFCCSVRHTHTSHAVKQLNLAEFVQRCEDGIGCIVFCQAFLEIKFYWHRLSGSGNAFFVSFYCTSLFYCQGRMTVHLGSRGRCCSFTREPQVSGKSMAGRTDTVSTMVQTNKPAIRGQEKRTTWFTPLVGIHCIVSLAQRAFHDSHLVVISR